MTEEEERAKIEQGVAGCLANWSSDLALEEALGFLRLNRLGTTQVNGVRTLLERIIGELERQDPEVVRAIKLRFWQGKVLQAVARELNVSIATAKRKCDHGISQITDMICVEEKRARQELVEKNLVDLPPQTHADLFGQNETLDRLEAELLTDSPPWIVALIGLGGIGKTAVANEGVRRILSTFRFERVIWIRNDHPLNAAHWPASAMVERLAAQLAKHLIERPDQLSINQQNRFVWQTLKAQPHLIVIDNLESESETLLLMDLLNGLANPSKFLLTTRSYQANQAGVFHLNVGELSPPAVKDLFFEQLKILGSQSKSAAAAKDRDDAVETIYETVGGHPLAIKLISRVLDVLPLSVILEDFRQGHHLSSVDVYQPIYKRIWSILSPEAQHILRKIGEIGDHDVRVEEMLSVFDLPEDRVWEAITELTRRSLIEVRGSLQEKRYGVHPLTQRFLGTGLSD